MGGYCFRSGGGGYAFFHGFFCGYHSYF
jgi:hypothetical protein